MTYKAIYNLPIITNKLLPQHIYTIVIEDDEDTGSGYNISITYDHTEDKEVNLFIRLASMKSIDRYFKRTA